MFLSISKYSAAFFFKVSQPIHSGEGLIIITHHHDSHFYLFKIEFIQQRKEMGVVCISSLYDTLCLSVLLIFPPNCTHDIWRCVPCPYKFRES